MSEPHKKRLQELKNKANAGKISKGEEIEMQNIEDFLESLKSNNPLDQARAGDGKKEKREKASKEKKNKA